MKRIKVMSYTAIVMVVGMMILLSFSRVELSSFCLHTDVITFEKVATCSSLGKKDSICIYCHKLVTSEVLKATGHDWGEYILTIKPSSEKNGIETRTCSNCELQEEREYICSHEKTYTSVIQQATCTENGIKNTICKLCSSVITSEVLKATGHDWGEYVLTIKPSSEKNGIETRICNVCGEQENREYICLHEEVYTSVTKISTCVEYGEQQTICKLCGSILSSKRLDLLNCLYGDWIYETEATPVKSGIRYKECSYCEKRKIESYTMTMVGENSIYIPGTGIHQCLTIGSFQQKDVDECDILYSEKVWSSDAIKSKNNPFVLEHKSRGLGELYKTQVGQYIYLSINGVVETYKVIVSEYAIDIRERRIIGQTTGINIYQTYDCKTLHLYTCYGDDDGMKRWIVLAQLVFTDD